MKKLLVAAVLAIAASGASASTFSIAPGGINTTFSGYNTTPGTGSYTSGILGNLTANYTGQFAATYLGSESGFANFYVGGTTLTEATVGARAVSSMVAGQALKFGFGENVAGGIYTNDTSGVNAGINNGGTRSFVILANYLGLKDFATDKAFDFLIGYNDSDPSDADFDDYVVGIGAVPVPAALPLLASALAAFGIARRKSKQI